MADEITPGQLSGIWITGAPGAPKQGITLNQLTGVWITGSPVSVTAGLTLNQLMGIWVTGGTTAAEALGEGGPGQTGRFNKIFQQHLISTIIAVVHAINEQD